MLQRICSGNLYFNPAQSFCAMQPLPREYNSSRCRWKHPSSAQFRGKNNRSYIGEKQARELPAVYVIDFSDI